MPDISVAVATDRGLITPIIRKADRQGPGADRRLEMKDLAARAKDGKLKPKSTRAALSPISNLGMFGIKDFCRRDQPAAGDDPRRRRRRRSGHRATRARSCRATMMTCTLSVDHRAVDGAHGRAVPAGLQGLHRRPAHHVAVSL
jgi:pyruvate dehydrogenase E2 component (dihydrolipoamide acetyltransferase)